ncbi:hypothetical protein MDAP_001970 [Mitosporidium daphniae]|uniref:ABC transporter n=1 Tax=Mitosporidium daphniae TaxID=1485682 RepID=A0A098VRZ0_9MICR|nr:uncharacterized protein DI09_69p100 [Mitosporidium daphniae]KGG50486.1 hypothetical protein DI09_69p100 [Mitosporidium daphniae]|eukprot:XP_013236913.1 uncharacterized protein DI09_69p100 [Mitosporidium daphniae]
MAKDFPKDKSEALRGPLVQRKNASLWSQFHYSWLKPLLVISLDRRRLYKKQALRNKKEKAVLPLSKINRNLLESDIGDIPHPFTSKDSWLRLQKSRFQPVKVPLGETMPTKGFQDDSVISAKYIFICLGKMVYRDLVFSGIFKAISEVSLLIIPLLLFYFLNALSGNTQFVVLAFSIDSRHLAYALGVSIFILSSFSSYSSKRSAEILRYTGTSVQAALSAAIYRKIFRLAPHTRSSHTNGRIFTLITSDVSRIDVAVDHIHVAWLGPLQILIISGLLFWILGPAAGAGLAMMIGSVPIQYLIVQRLAKKRIQAISATDCRVRFVDQMLTGIRVVVLNDWEDAFCKYADDLRAKELSEQLALHSLIAMLTTLMNATPIMASLVAFAMALFLAPTASTLSTSTIFAAISMFSQLRSAMGTFPPFLSRLIDAKISLKRISELLRSEELHPSSMGPIEMDTAIELKDFWASWSGVKNEESSKPFISTKIMKSLSSLRDITLSIPTGATVILIGPVGSGKSSLLQAILGEINIVSGSLHISPSLMDRNTFGYSPQQPWISHGSLRENILFGCKFNSSRYGAILSACQLREDIKSFPLGDLVEIGGATSALSGGQRQRISLARALYSNAEILLLDDPVSALDAKVAKIVWENAIVKSSTLNNGKTKIISTHALHLIRPDSCDWIVCMDKGRIKWQGPPEEWFASHAERMPNRIPLLLANENIQQPQAGNTARISTDCPHTSFAISSMKTIHSLESITCRPQDPETPKEPFMEAPIQETESIFADELRELETFEEGPRKGHRFPLKEDKSEFDEEKIPSISSLPLSIYVRFLDRFGWVLFVLTLFFLVLVNFSRISTERMLAQIGESSLKDRWMIWAMAFAFVTSTAFFTLLVSVGAWNAARSTYRDAFSGILMMTPLAFIDKFPFGFLMNRLTKDTECSDFDILDAGRDLLGKACAVFSVLVLVAFTMSPWMAFFLPVFLLLANWTLLRLYHRPMLDLERLCSHARSAYLGQVRDTLGGLPLIRSRSFPSKDNQLDIQALMCPKVIMPLNMGLPSVQELFMEKNFAASDWLVAPTLLLASLRSWASLRFELVANLSVAATTFFCVYEGISPALAGLVIHQLMMLAKSLYTSIVSFADLEIALCSFRRLYELGDESRASVKEMPSYPLPTTLPPGLSFGATSFVLHKNAVQPHSSPLFQNDHWPYEGAVEFSNVTLSYLPDGGRPVLCDINFEVRPGERLAIIGRTGSGKSTLVQALFGLIPVSEGCIKIDNVDISCIPGSMIRQRLAIIPQDPVIFYGRTLRFNLDPLNCYSDERIWAMLEACAIGPHLRATLVPPSLDTILREGSAMLSQGQSQLLCLTRALLKNSRILVLDEATSNVDKALDTLIQETIRRVSVPTLARIDQSNPNLSPFDIIEHPVTVITIAHRLLSILDYDRIMVLQDGFIAELDTPRSLFKNPDSLFTQLVRELGQAEYQHVAALLGGDPGEA